MKPLDKRSLLLGTAALMTGGITAAASRTARVPSGREILRQRRFPNVPLVSHAGRELRFYDDVLKDRKVVVNFMYTVCSNICSPVTQNMLQAQRLLGSFADDIHFYSISLTPLEDDPAALRAYMQAQGVRKGWTFLTGKPQHIEQVRRGLGFAQGSAAEDADLSNHAGMLRIGNERMVSWGHASALSSGRSIARMIRFELG